MGVGDQRHAPAALPPWKIPGTHYRGGWVDPRECLTTPGFDPCTIRPVAIGYTNWAIAANSLIIRRW